MQNKILYLNTCILDSTFEVSKHLNHLLKSPFCVHPGTGMIVMVETHVQYYLGRVCVPIDTTNVDDFNPLEVPILSDLLQEINEWDAKNTEDQTNESHISGKYRFPIYIDPFLMFRLQKDKSEIVYRIFQRLCQ